MKPIFKKCLNFLEQKYECGKVTIRLNFALKISVILNCVQLN